MRSHARRRNRPEDANAWWSSTASDHTTFARFMASNVSTFSRASRSRICVRGSARASNRGAPRFCFCFRESLASFARRCHAVATFTVFISRHSRATTANSASAVVHDETKVQEGRAKRSSDLTRRPKKRLVARLGKTSRPNRFAGGADAFVPSTHWMIRLLMATKPRIAPAPDARSVLPPGLLPASERGRPAKGSLPLAAAEACAKCPEEGTADACACHAVERAAHEGEAPERHERGTTRRPTPASAAARVRRIGKPPRSRGREQPTRRMLRGRKRRALGKRALEVGIVCHLGKYRRNFT